MKADHPNPGSGRPPDNDGGESQPTSDLPFVDTLDGEASELYRLFQRGRRALQEGHPGQATVYLEKAKKLAPEKNSIREALGRAYFALGLFAQAEAEFRLIVERVPTNDYALYALGRCLLALGREDEARGCLRLAAAMSPKNVHYQCALRRCYDRGGDEQTEDD